MLHWLPFCTYLVVAIIITIDAFSRYRQFGKCLTVFACFCYFVIILRLCLTPISFSFISADRNLRYFHGVPYNLIPFQQLDLEWFLNIIMTIPLGILLYLIGRKSPFVVILCLSLLSSFFIEGNQFVCDFLFQIDRVADIDDIITNTLGGIIGFYGLKLFDRGVIDKIIQPFFLS
ncbi:VanZ family protein [Limosilactobacillus agrestimuris]|uniref:VanZ family protein n=1 Tax=Limosilactobacillus agrestimuris TaxID=2941331 RepID=UPI00203E7E8D|nr:VanZ family protein [Limosilactobacillus agrestimuris]